MSKAPSPHTNALVVLGCRVLPSGAASTALALRVDHAIHLWHDLDSAWFIVSGGRRWNGVSEAECMRERAERSGVPAAYMLMESRSTNTRQNALYSSELIEQHAVTRVTLVTSDWHMARAVLAFRRAGVAVHPSPAITPPGGWVPDTARHVREGLRRGADRIAMLFESLR